MNKASDVLETMQITNTRGDYYEPNPNGLRKTPFANLSTQNQQEVERVIAKKRRDRDRTKQAAKKRRAQRKKHRHQ